MSLWYWISPCNLVTFYLVPPCTALSMSHEWHMILMFVLLMCQRQREYEWFWTRRLRISAANIGPNRFHQKRTVSWQISIPRSNSRSSTWRSDNGYRTYIITVRRIISGELLKYRKGFFIPGGYGMARPGSSRFSLIMLVYMIEA